MRKEEFDGLDILDRVNYVGNNGDYIALREFKNYLIGLYMVNGFFAEVQYRNGREIDMVESLSEEEVLSLYMTDIDFSTLFE